MSLLSKFSKVEKNFMGQCGCLTWHKFLSLQNPAVFFKFWRFLEYMKHLPLLKEIPLTAMTSYTRWKKMAASVKSQQNARRSIVASVMAASSRFSYSRKIPLSTLKRHRGKQLLCEVYCLIFRICWWGSESVQPFPCSRSHTAEVRNHEGRDIERKVWLFYEVKCHRLKQVFPRIAYDWNTVRTWLYLFWW